jgi:hypothetical protein
MHDNFRAINQSYAMVSVKKEVKKEVERGVINGSSQGIVRELCR